MAVPLEAFVDLTIRQAQQQIDRLQTQLDTLEQPIDVPVNIEGGNADAVARDLRQAGGAADELRSDLDRVDDSLRDAGTAARRAGDDIEDIGRRGRRAFDGLGTSLLAFGSALGGAVALRGFVNFAGDAIEAASDLEESTSKAQVVFGSFFSDIEDFAATAPQALGLANAEAIEFAGTFGNLFTALGLTQQAAADLAPDIVQLGADLASFNNIDVTEALEKLRAGLVGEAEPLRTLGVNLNAAAVEAKAMELGLTDATGAVDEAAKVQARYAIILEQTVNAQGDFARTADGIANRQRTLAAQFTELQAAVGEALLPAFEAILEVAPEIVAAIEQGLVPAFAGLAASVEGFDASGFVENISGLPSAIGSVFTQIGAGTQTVGNAVQVFASLARLDFTDVGDQFQQLGDDIQRFREAPVANQAIQNLITTLSRGAEPAAALEAVLKELGGSVSALDPETFEELANQLLAMAEAAGADPGQLRDLANDIRVFGEDAGFSSIGVKILTDVLTGPWAQAMAEASSGDIIIANLARSMAETGEAAAEAGPLISGFGGALDGLPDGADAFASIVDSLESELERLPGIFGIASQALEDAEGEAITTAEDFLENLRGVFEAERLFEDNIEAARALGLDNLVAAAEEFGPEFAPILADALANPATAALIDSQFAEFADDRAANARQAMQTALLQEFANAPLEVILDVDVVLGNVRLPGAGNILENISIPGTGSISNPTSGNRQGSGDIIINNNGPAPSTVDAAKQAQIVSNVVRSQR